MDQSEAPKPNSGRLSRSARRFSARTRPRLVLGGLAAAAGMSLTGCDSTPEFRNAEFTSVSACTSAGFPSDLCEAEYGAAVAEHQRSAPRFSSQVSCEKEWGTGQCAPAFADSVPGAATQGTVVSGSSSGGSVFVPALAGFLVSQALQRQYYNNGGLGGGYYGGYGGYRGGPIYRDRTGGTVTVDRSGGKAVTKPVNVNTRTVASRGFGGMGMSRGGGFGG